MKILRGIMGVKRKWKEDSYESVFSLCASLINASVQMHPLRTEDAAHHHSVKIASMQSETNLAKRESKPKRVIATSDVD